MTSERSSITLRALSGRPLLDPVVRDMVIATAHSIAERNGVTLAAIHTSDDALTATLEASRLVALGFAAELRRVTSMWYTKKYSEPTLWGEPGEPPGQAPEWDM